jgi:hypothetical protein
VEQVLSKAIRIRGLVKGEKKPPEEEEIKGKRRSCKDHWISSLPFDKIKTRRRSCK